MRVGAIAPHTKYEAKAATTGPDGEILAGIYQRMTRIKQNEGRFRAVFQAGLSVAIWVGGSATGHCSWSGGRRNYHSCRRHVYPAEVEAALNSLPAIAASGVAGQPSGNGEEEIVALVEVGPGIPQHRRSWYGPAP